LWRNIASMWFRSSDSILPGCAKAGHTYRGTMYRDTIDK
jgi:hypothetical protein